MNLKKHTRFQPALEALESRELMTLGLSSLVSNSLVSNSLVSSTLVSKPITTSVITQKTTISSDLSAILLNPIYQIPQLSSMPGSAHTLYLNFGGDSRADWFNIDYGTTNENHYKNVKMGVFDTDGDLTTLTSTEKSQITEIWARVAEAYAPYDVNVTTVSPASLAHGKTLTVDIGKSNGWLGTTNTGISSIGSFASTAPNVVFDFCDQIGSYLGGPKGPLDTANNPNFVMQVADTAVHESGHGFGLLHDRLYNADHSVQSEYDPGTATWTPYMGNNLTAARHTWTLGIVDYNDNTPVLQWEPGKLGTALGYRADDFGDDIAHATPLSFSLFGAATTKGVIGYHPPTFLFEQPDVDVFSFTTQAGSVSLEADVLPYKNGADLDARLELWTNQGMVAATTAPVGSNARLTANLAGGTYFVKVMSGGGLTDAGQYTLTVSHPSGLTVAHISGSKAFTVQGLIGNSGGAMAVFTPQTTPSNLDAIAIEAGLTTPGTATSQADKDALTALLLAQTRHDSGLSPMVSAATLDALFAGDDLSMIAPA
jgi:hypothetical protein